MNKIKNQQFTEKHPILSLYIFSRLARKYVAKAGLSTEANLEFLGINMRECEIFIGLGRFLPSQVLLVLGKAKAGRHSLPLGEICLTIKTFKFLIFLTVVSVT